MDNNNTQHTQVKLKVQDTILAFDSNEWQKTGDIGDNSQFYKFAVIVKLYHNSYNEQIADIRWQHNGKLSKGHFVQNFK